jgi:hypothetical protein
MFLYLVSAFDLTIDLQVPAISRLSLNGSPSRQAATQVHSGVDHDKNVSVIPVVTVVHLHFISLGELQQQPSHNPLLPLPPYAKPSVAYYPGGPAIWAVHRCLLLKSLLRRVNRCARLIVFSLTSRPHA